jgi:hypothetical protein
VACVHWSGDTELTRVRWRAARVWHIARQLPYDGRDVPGEHQVGGDGLPHQRLRRGGERPARLLRIQVARQCGAQRPDHLWWQVVRAMALRNRQAVSDAGQREDLVTQPTEQEIGLPDPAPGKARPCVQREQPAGAHEKYTKPRFAASNVEVMHGAVALVHFRGPVRAHVRLVHGAVEPRGEIDIRPVVFSVKRRRSGQRGRHNPRISLGAGYQRRTEPFACLLVEHSWRHYQRSSGAGWHT